MRKSRVRAIRAQELANPNGMSSASFRRAKRDYSNGMSRTSQPKSERPKGVAGFPKNRKPYVATFMEKDGISRIITTERTEGKNRRKVETRILYKFKKVTRVLTSRADQ